MEREESGSGKSGSGLLETLGLESKFRHMLSQAPEEERKKMEKQYELELKIETDKLYGIDKGRAPPHAPHLYGEMRVRRKVLEQLTGCLEDRLGKVV